MTTKKPLQYLSFVLMLFITACGETKLEENTVQTISDTITGTPEVAKPEEVPLDKVAAIRTEVERINQMKLLVESFSWREDGCVDEGKVNYYLNNDTIVKVTESGFIGDGGWTKAYYYKNGKFIFSFMQSIGGPAGMPVDTSEIRMYADHDTLVLQKRNDKSFNDLSEKFTNSSTEYRLLNAYKSKNFAAVFCR